MNLSKDKYVCRSCLTSEISMKNLFQTTVRDAFVDATKIEISENDGLPSWLCNYCYHTLLKSIRLKILASKADAFLKNTMNTNNIDFKKFSNYSSSVLDYTAVFHNDVCADCSNISIDHVNHTDHNVNVSYIYSSDISTAIKTISIEINDLKDKNNTSIAENCIKTENFQENKFCNMNYSSENDSFLDEMKDSNFKIDLESKRNQQLESEDSPLILIAKGTRLGRKKDTKLKKTLKIKKYQENPTEKLLDKNIKLNYEIAMSSCDNIISETLTEQGEKSENAIFVKSSFKGLIRPDPGDNSENEKLFNNTRRSRKLHKHPKINRIKKMKNFPSGKLLRSKLRNGKQLSDKIENDSTAVMNCDMSRVATIEMNFDEQILELKLKRESEQFKSARYKCEKCIKVFPYEDSLKNHLMRHDKSYGCCECSLCGQRFLTPRVLKSHQMAHAKRYRCLECNRILKFKATVTHHMMRHGGTYSCRMCGHLSTNKEANKIHQRTHSHQDTYNCSLCPKVLSTKQDYGIHMRRHSGDMPFECVECTKLFLTNAALQSHRAVHSTSRHFYCAECDVSFKTKDIMLTHFRKSSKHVDPASLRYQCELCPKRFPSEEALASHSDSYHTRSAKLACDACPAQFVSSNGLRNHKRTVHEGYRPRLTHVCEACGRAFSTKALVTNHLRTHTGEQPFECPTCQRRFSQRSAMQTHIKLVHLKIKRNMSIPKDKPLSSIEPMNISLLIPPKEDSSNTIIIETNSSSRTILY